MGRKRLADRRKVRFPYIIFSIFLCSARANLLGCESILQVVYGDKTFMTGCYRCAISKLPLFHGDSLTSFRARQMAFHICKQLHPALLDHTNLQQSAYILLNFFV
jgi:hypothetical protein